MNYKHTQKRGWLLGILFVFTIVFLYIAVTTGMSIISASISIFVSVGIIYIFLAKTQLKIYKTINQNIEKNIK